LALDLFSYLPSIGIALGIAIFSAYLAYRIGRYKERENHRTNWSRIFSAMREQMKKNDYRIGYLLDQGNVSRFPMLYGAFELAARADPIEDIDLLSRILTCYDYMKQYNTYLPLYRTHTKIFPDMVWMAKYIRDENRKIRGLMKIPDDNELRARQLRGRRYWEGSPAF